MKSYNHLYEQMLTEDNARRAILDTAKGKKKKREVAIMLSDIDGYIPKILAYAENFKPQKHHVREIYDGIEHKKRTIVVPRLAEQVVHHMVMNVLAPILRHGMYEHSYASMPGMGLHKAKRFIRKWLDNDVRRTKYYLKLDVRHFFQSIDRELLIKKLRVKIHDERFMNLLTAIIDSAEGDGLPLGFYTSHWLANFYLTEVDHYIKNELKIAHYIRYMDDMVLFDSNKRKLHRTFIAVQSFMECLKLNLKGNYTLARFNYVRGNVDRGRFLDFLGFRFYRDRTTLRRALMLKIARKAKRLKAKGKPTCFDVRQFMSLYGWTRHTDSHGFKKSRIFPYIRFKKLKTIIRKEG